MDDVASAGTFVARVFAVFIAFVIGFVVSRGGGGVFSVVISVASFCRCCAVRGCGGDVWCCGAGNLVGGGAPLPVVAQSEEAGEDTPGSPGSEVAILIWVPVVCMNYYIYSRLL